MSRFSMFIAGAVVAVAAVVIPVAPAHAHDSIVSSDPAPDARLDVAPEQVSLQFSGELLELGDSGAFVIVAGADGRDWVASPPEIDGSSVTAELSDGMPQGAYEISWQVVSQDGHPISGVVPFTVGEEQPPAAEEPEVSATPQDGADTQDQADAPGEADAQDQADDDGGPSRIIIVGIVGAALAAAAFALFTIIRRRSARKGEQ